MKSGNIATLTTFVAMAVAVLCCAMLFVPNYISGGTMAAESHLALAVWSLLGFIFYRRIYKKDALHKYGFNSVVWMLLIMMVTLSTLMWARQATCDIFDKIAPEMTTRLGVSQRLASIKNDFNAATLVNSAIEAVLLLASVAVMFNLYSILRKRETDLVAQKTLAEETNKAKSLFFSTVSHDIRTPLNAIIGFSQMLKLGGKSEEEREQALDAILLSGQTLLDLINDVLDLSKLEAGKMQILPEPVDCRKLLEGVMETFRVSPKCKDGKVELRSHIAKMPPLMLDPHRIRQIVFNIVGNAMKFTESGHVEMMVSFSELEDAPGFGSLSLSIEDTGCGISEADLKRIASPYVQVGSRNNRAVGTGLGLAICRQLVAAMGGGIAIDSALGRGTTFTINLPKVKISSEFGVRSSELTPVLISQDSQNPRESTESERSDSVDSGRDSVNPVKSGQSAKRILIADDQKLNRMVLKTMLTKLGDFDLTLAENGKEALDILKASEADGKPKFDMVLTDLWMPELDGEGLVKAIREDPALKDLPVFVVTADVEMNHGAERLGFTGVLLKPVTIEKVKELVS